MLIPCLACESRFGPDEYFNACSDYDRGMDLVSWTCPRCGNRDDLRVLPGELGFGYPHRGRFDVHDRLRVPGLRFYSGVICGWTSRSTGRAGGWRRACASTPDSPPTFRPSFCAV